MCVCIAWLSASKSLAQKTLLEVVCMVSISSAKHLAVFARFFGMFSDCLMDGLKSPLLHCNLSPSLAPAAHSSALCTLWKLLLVCFSLCTHPPSLRFPAVCYEARWGGEGGDKWRASVTEIMESQFSEICSLISAVALNRVSGGRARQTERDKIYHDPKSSPRL